MAPAVTSSHFCFGPLFIVFGSIFPKSNGVNLTGFLVGIGGALMTSIATTIMFREIVTLRKLVHVKPEIDSMNETK